MAAAAETFWDRSAEKYAKSPVRDEEAYAATLERVRVHLPAEANALEVGCGTGTTALKLAPDVARLVATDISAKMIAIAEEKRRAADADNVSFQQATLEDHSFDDGAFDVVFAFNFLHLHADIPAALSEIHRLLKPGGLFFSKTVCLKEWKSLFPLLIPVMQLIGKAPYVKSLNSDALDGMIADAGFDIVETGYYPEKSRSRFVVARKAG